jgi:hypothetical protein
VRILKAATPDARRALEPLLSLRLLDTAKPGLSPAELRCLISQRARER